MPPTPRCRPPCAISPSASCPSTKTLFPIATWRTSRRCKWWPATRPRRTRRVSRCRSGGRASNGHRRRRAVVYDIYTQARAIEAAQRVPFASAYAKAFRDTLNRLDDLRAYKLEDEFMKPTEPLQKTVQRALDQRRGKSSIALDEALELVQAWFAFDAYRSFGGLVRPLLAEDKERRYVIEEVTIPASKDATIAATLVRPRQRYRRRHTADAARVHARSIEPGCARARGPRLRQRARACAHRWGSEVSAARAVRVRRRRCARRHRVDRQAAVERRPGRHAGRGLRRLRRVVGGEATAGCIEGDRDVRPDGARHRLCRCPTGSC